MLSPGAATAHSRHREARRGTCLNRAGEGGGRGPRSERPLGARVQYRFDYEGISDAGQETITALAERTRAWKFVAVIDAAQHADCINHRGKISSDYSEMQIDSGKENWVEGIENWDLISYSVPQNIASLIAKDSITFGGFFHHVSHAVRRSVPRDMLDGIPSINMTWTAMHLGLACIVRRIPRRNQAYLAASNMEKDGADLNPYQMIRVDVQGSTEAPPKKRGPEVGSVRPRPPLAALDSLLNAIGIIV
jgi:hypothetical protein